MQFERNMEDTIRLLSCDRMETQEFKNKILIEVRNLHDMCETVEENRLQSQTHLTNYLREINLLDPEATRFVQRFQSPDDSLMRTYAEQCKRFIQSQEESDEGVTKRFKCCYSYKQFVAYKTLWFALQDISKNNKVVIRNSGTFCIMRVYVARMRLLDDLPEAIRLNNPTRVFCMAFVILLSSFAVFAAIFVFFKSVINK